MLKSKNPGSLAIKITISSFYCLVKVNSVISSSTFFISFLYRSLLNAFNSLSWDFQLYLLIRTFTVSLNEIKHEKIMKKCMVFVMNVSGIFFFDLFQRACFYFCFKKKRLSLFLSGEQYKTKIFYDFCFDDMWSLIRFFSPWIVFCDNSDSVPLDFNSRFFLSVFFKMYSFNSFLPP